MAKRVLIVDDSKSTRQMISFTLRRAGYEVVEAEDGRQALELAAKDRIDCVITDLNMPEMDGLELIRRLRASPSTASTPILLLTTTIDVDKKEQGHAAGATGWIGKPFHPAALLEKVAKTI